MECPPAELIVAYVDGTLAGDDRASVERHADTCATCRMAVSNLAAGSIALGSTAAGDFDPGAEPVVEAGAAIGRYIVLYKIGRGGMATVYAAFDPELDRKIALKVLRGRGHRDHDRLRREARTLAALTHPNVVNVFDVGDHDGLLFIAMELVEGQTVREWLAKGPHAWRELAPVFVGAANALAAAHAKGIVHRDVKPENLLLDKTGVVHVSDFGLAAIAEQAIDAVAGTPGYMAPEQFHGEVSAASDQYGFCVTLREAIAKTTVPRAITDAVARGTAARPMDRHASMTALAKILAIDPRRRNKRIALGVAVAAVAIGGVAAFTRSSVQCELSTDRWSAKREAVRGAFATAHPKAAERAFAAVDTSLAAYLDAWRAMATDSCKRTHERGDQSASLLDLRTRCLDQRLAAAGALVDVLASGTMSPSVVEGAVFAVAGLPPIAACADVTALTAIVPPADARIAKQVDALKSRFAKAIALQLTAQYTQAAAIVTPALPEVVQLDYAPLLAEARWLEGDLHYRAGDYAASVTALKEAVAQAARGRDDRTAARAMTLLAGIVGYAQGKPDEGMALALAADAWLTRAGRAPEDEAELADIRGLLHDAKGEPLLAKPFYERALALREQLYGKDHLMVALSLNNMAGVPDTLGKRAEARALHERALAIREKALGPVAADVAVSVNALASLDEDEQKFVEAERGFRRAIAIWEAVLGPDHPDVAVAHNNLGNMLRRTENYAGAIVELEKALAIWKDHPSAVSAIGNLAITYYEQKDYAKALTTFNTAIEQTKARLGDKHPTLASDYVNRGQTLDHLGRHDEAGADLQLAVKIFDEVLPPGDRRLAWALTIFGKHELQAQRVAPATKSLARALAILEADKEARPQELAAARFALARAKWEAGERKPAIDLAKLARTGTTETQIIDDWLKGKK